MAKKKVITEPNIVRTKRGPKCVLHGVRMRYVPEEVVWKCPEDGCTQVAFPKQEITSGRPIVGRGALELVHIPDPEGSKHGVWMLRAMDNNVMINITDELVAEIGMDITIRVYNISQL